MRRTLLLSWFAIVSIAVMHTNAFAFVYYIDEFIQNNGSVTFLDSFADGNEPPEGPYTGADYYVEGDFGSNRENNGLLELNKDDGIWDDDDMALEVFVVNNTYFFSSGSGGNISGAFQLSDRFLRNTDFAVALVNDVDVEEQEDEAFAGIAVSPEDGRIYAVWGDENDDHSEDITSAIGDNAKVTVKLVIDTSNRVSARWDFGSDGTFDLTKTNMTQIDFIYGNFTGGFGVWAEVTDYDHDGIIEDGDFSGTIGDNPCAGGNTANCDDNCLSVANNNQTDTNNNGIGDVCEPPAEHTLKVQALIDGRSHLLIQGGNAWWHHYEWVVPGRWGTWMPTIINGYNWYPDWPGPDDNWFCDCDSSVYTSLDPPLPADGSTFDLVWVSGRGDVSVVQQPAQNNSYTAIIEFNDYQPSAEFYEIALSYASEPASHSLDTDNDWQIGDFELLAAIDDWAGGSLGDFELLNLIDFWAAGCYQWDEGSGDYRAGC